MAKPRARVRRTASFSSKSHVRTRATNPDNPELSPAPTYSTLRPVVEPQNPSLVLTPSEMDKTVSKGIGAMHLLFLEVPCRSTPAVRPSSHIARPNDAFRH